MYQHHECVDRGCMPEVRSAHLRATLVHRKRTAAKLRGARPRVRWIQQNGSE